jgi:hypothetical protein
MQRAGSIAKVTGRSPAVRRGVLPGIGKFWCLHMHEGITWPVRGYYECRTCHRTYAVPWEEPAYHSIAISAKKQQPRPEVRHPRSVAA